MNIPKLNVGKAIEAAVEWISDNLEFIFDAIGGTVSALVTALEFLLLAPHPILMVGILTAIAWYFASRGVAIFTALGMLLIVNMGYWAETMETLTLVLGAVLLALIIGIPIGIWTAKSAMAERVVRPILDFMQTLPAFVYLIPAVTLLSLGAVPAVIATLIFCLPPAVRLTNLGIRQVPSEIREAALSFGANPRQLLFKAELPVALPTIMAGVNQTIMLALSMVVVAGLIGAGGLGNLVLKGLQQMKMDVGFDAGLSIVILAIFLDRVTQSLSKSKEQK